MKNYIPINRKLFDHYLWEEKRTYSKFEAWLDLLQLVSFKNNNSQLIKGELVKWNRGQYPVTYSFLEKRWGWGTSKVRKYISLLKKEKMITTDRTGNWTVLTICKYDSYNSGKTDLPTDYKTDLPTDLEQQLNKVNKEKKEIMLLWLNYRREIKKPITVLSTMKSLVNRFNKEPLVKCVWVVEKSIENKYTGLFWDNYKPSASQRINKNISYGDFMK